MATGYTRQSAADIVDAAVINASDFNAEFNQLQSTFNTSTGHTHDGVTTGGGAAINYNNLTNLPTLGTAAAHSATDFLLKASNLSDVVSISSARTNLGLGSMATQNLTSVSISGGNIVGASITGLSAPSGSTDAATKLYADTGSVLLQTFPSLQTGFGIQYFTTSSLVIFSGLIIDNGSNVLKMQGNMIKLTAAPWAVGTNGGGMGTGLTIAANTWYDVYVVKITIGGTTDIYFDLANSTAHAPAGVGLPQRIGSFLTDGSASIINFRQVGQTIYWATPVSILNGSSIPASLTNLNLSTSGAVPPKALFPILTPITFTGGTTGVQTYTVSGAGGSLTTNPTYVLSVNGTNVCGGSVTGSLPTTSLGVIQHASSSTTNTVVMSCAGWVDPALSPFARSNNPPFI